MQQLEELLRQVTAEARALGIPVSGQVELCPKLNGRATSRLGCCRAAGEGFRIELSGRTAGNPRAQRELLAHELLHTCPGCQNHGPLFKAYAGAMNRAYGYSIATRADPKALGIPPLEPRYLLRCRSCGREFPRQRASRLTRSPGRYRCSCGGELERVFPKK